MELRKLCATHGVKWCYQGRVHDLDSDDDRFTTGLDALLAEREAAETSKRIRRSTASQAQRGAPHGRRLFGYRRTYDATTGRLTGQEPEPAEADTVRAIFAAYVSGKGVRTIARELNAEGLETGTGAQWADSQVKRVLQNPAYVAQRVHRGEIVGPADWPALVDDASFARAGARFDDLARNRRRVTSTARMLTGVARCGVCGSKMNAQHDRTRRKVYSCRGSHCVARDLTKLDLFVSDAIVARLGSPDVAEMLERADLPEVTSARERVDELRARLDDAADRFARGDLSASMLARVEQRLKPDIETAERAARSAAMPLELDLPAGDDVEQWWAELEPTQRREVVNALVDVVEVRRTKRGTRTFDPEAVSIIWR